MAPLIKQSGIEDIRAHSDIVDTIGSYIPLKRAGSGFKALCPFHKEKTPSFNVSPQRQIYHCFGCGAGGDVFKFVMEHEGVDFVTAAKLLARKAGLHIELGEGDRKEGRNKDVLYRIHEDLAQTYQRALLETEGAESARRYLEERGIGADLIEEFLLGFAPANRSALATWAEKKKYALRDLETAGLLARSEGREDHYDRFQGRLMFPIRDELSRVVGFSGRLLGKSDRAAKYVNSPETVLFKKGRILYGLDKARRAIVDARQAIVCEGQFDVIRCHQAGFKTAVAPQGTALTEDHARLLKRYADEVVLVFDADTAGQNAALRSGGVCLSGELAVRIAVLPTGQDPDSLIRAGGPDALREILESATSLMDFQIDLLSAREDLGTESGLRRVARAVQETVAASPSDVQREQLLQRAAQRLSLPEDVLRRELSRKKRRPASASPPGQGTERTEHPPIEVALVELLQQDESYLDLVHRHLPLDHIEDVDCRAIASAMLRRTDEDWNLMSELAGESDECLRLAAQVQAAPAKRRGDTFHLGEDIKDVILRIWQKHLEKRRRELLQKAEKAAEGATDDIRVECSQLTIDLKHLGQGWEAALPILELDALTARERRHPLPDGPS